MSILPINELPIKHEGTELSVFYMPRSGKPDPNAPWVPGEARPRVPQRPQKGQTCWHYGPQALRYKIGNNHPPQENYIKARQFEKACSTLRKGHTHAYHVSFHVNRVANSNMNIEQEEKNSLNAICYAELLNQPLKEIKKLKRAHQGLVDAMEVVKRFQEQTTITSLHAYNQENNIKAELQQELQFFHAVGVDPSVMFANLSKISTLKNQIFYYEGRQISYHPFAGFEEFLTKYRGNYDDSWKSVPVSLQNQMLATFRNDVIAQRLGFYPSCWQPHHTIDQLIKALNTEGSLYIVGFFGENFYTQKATPKTTKYSRSVYGWEANDRKTTERLNPQQDGIATGHAVLIIGAEKLEAAPGEGMVYYADPNVGSNPKKPEAQNFFRIPYQELANHVTPRQLIPPTHQTGFELSNSALKCYALYCKPQEAIFPNQEKPIYGPIRVCVDITMDPKSRLGICFAPSWNVPIACAPVTGHENWWECHVLRGVEFSFVKINPDHTVEQEKRVSPNLVLAPHWPVDKTLFLHEKILDK
jgi:hypothetical protein